MKPLLTKLTTWKKTDEDEEFVEKAIDSLYKKLKVKQGSIEELQRALNNPTLPSRCVTIPRSLDGRLQVSHRKGLPHVIYCRIFRWPDLQTHHELKSIESCEFSFNSKQSEVCINPLHYERIDVPILPPVLVPKHVEFSMGQSIIYNNINPSASYNSMDTSESFKNKENVFAYNNQNAYNNSNNSASIDQLKPTYNSSPSPASISICNYRSNINNNTNYSYYYNNFNNSNISNTSSNNFYNLNNTYSSNGSPHQTSLEESNESISNMSPEIHSNEQVEQKPSLDYQEPLNWCSIVYYELNTRIGEVFSSTSNDIFVDGYTNPCNSNGRRFCLGMFSNINRNSTIENCRKHIGRGIHLYNANGDIYVECLSESPIFIQSRNCNYDRGFHPNTVCKLPSGYSLRIFQSKLFAELLSQSVNQGYNSVYDLSNMCVIRLSFVKGWGADYYRQDVSSCPCWIEIRLNEAFQWLDKVLKEMGTCLNPVTSVS